MNNDNFQPLSPTPALTAAGVKHVMLTYHYRDVGDIDGYASLLDKDVALDQPSAPSCRGRAEVLKAHTAMATPYSRHELVKVVAEGNTVVVIGRMVLSTPTPDPRPGRGVDFADVFTLSDESLVLGCRRYYCAAPPEVVATDAVAGAPR